MSNTGNIGLRFLSTNIDGSTGVSPQTGEWILHIASSGITENIFINEFLAINNTVNVDESSEYDDWLELYNSSSDTINLHNHYLSDDPDNLTKAIDDLSSRLKERYNIAIDRENCEESENSKNSQQKQK